MKRKHLLFKEAVYKNRKSLIAASVSEPEASERGSSLIGKCKWNIWDAQ